MGSGLLLQHPKHVLEQVGGPSNRVLANLLSSSATLQSEPTTPQPDAALEKWVADNEADFYTI
jgi:hypothetical protein